MAQLRGDLPLPWEGEMPARMQHGLGALKGPVLQLLRRDPAERVSVQRFHAACARVFSNQTTIEA